MAPERPLSPYLRPGFYAEALAQGRHRDIVGGRWDETGRIHMAILRDLGLQPHHRVLDIGAGALRTGCRLVPFLNPGNYWATDLSRDLMLTGYHRELTETDRARLPQAQLIEDADFALPGVPRDLDMVICFAVLTHLPGAATARALSAVADHVAGPCTFAFTVFLAPDAASYAGPVRQVDGVVTHPDRAPWHLQRETVETAALEAGFDLALRPDRMPRGQVLCLARKK